MTLHRLLYGCDGTSCDFSFLNQSNHFTKHLHIAATVAELLDVKLDTEGELAKLILAMYEKILSGATLYDLRRAADAVKASTLKPIV